MAAFININQVLFRARNDDGSETTATWIAAANTDWTQLVGVNFRVRFALQADTGAGNQSPVSPGLQYNKNGAGWVQVTSSSSVVKLVSSSNFADLDATTQQISSGLGLTFVAGSCVESSTNAASRSLIAATNDTEDEWCLSIVSADVSDADTIQLRGVTLAAGTFATYTVTPTITVSKPAASNTGGGFFAFA